MSDRETQIDDIDQIREGIQAELDGSWEFDSLHRLDRFTAEASNVAWESPHEVGPLADPLTELLSRTVNEEYSTAGEMIGKENLLRSVKQQSASSLAVIAIESPVHVAPVLTELTRVAIREDDEVVRDELETVFDSVVGENHDAVCEVVTVLEDALNVGDIDDRSRAVETVGWIGYRDSTAVADLIETLQSLTYHQNIELSREVLNTHSRIVEDPVSEETATPEDVIAFVPTAGTYLSTECEELRASAASFLNGVSREDPSAVVNTINVVPNLVKSLIEADQAGSDAGMALKRALIEDPSAIARTKPQLQAGLANDDSVVQEQTAKIVKDLAGGEFAPILGRPSIVADLVPELADLLIESEQARSEAGKALERVGVVHPDAIAEITPRLQAGFTADSPDLQERTAQVVCETATEDPGAVVSFVPELADLLVDVESEQARSEARKALEQIGEVKPEAIDEVTPRLRTGLTDDDPAIQGQTAGVVKMTAMRDPSVFG